MADDMSIGSAGGSYAYLQTDAVKVPDNVQAPDPAPTAESEIQRSVQQDFLNKRNTDSFERGSCSVVSGPTYKSVADYPIDPHEEAIPANGQAPTEAMGVYKGSRLTMAAEFANNPTAGQFAACCQVRQETQVDQQYKDFYGQRSPGCLKPDEFKANTWSQDCDVAGGQYGHREAPFNKGDGYSTNGVPDQANGNVYTGRDLPMSWITNPGTAQVRMRVIDTCQGGVERAVTAPVTLFKP
jgi:hypothetical protein